MQAFFRSGMFVFILAYWMTPCFAQELASYAFDARGMAGTLRSVGSDTMNQLMLAWSEAFRTHYPAVRFEIDGAGSSKAIPALIQGSSFGPMSRPLKASEIADFESKFGYPPVVVPTCLDLVTVVVHRDNPIGQLSLEELDGVFGATFRRGGGTIERWEQLAMKDFGSAVIQPIGRNAASGTYLFFKEAVLQGGDFRDRVSELPGSSAIVHAVSTERHGIGYCGAGQVSSAVRIVPLSRSKDTPPYLPTTENALEGSYPLARVLYLVFHRDPKLDSFDPLLEEFLRFITSQEGQKLVVDSGHVPLPPNHLRSAWSKAGITLAFPE